MFSPGLAFKCGPFCSEGTPRFAPLPSVHMCALLKRDRLSLPWQSKQSRSLNSLLKELRHTHTTDTHTHTPSRKGKCVMKTCSQSDSTPPPHVCKAPWVLFDNTSVFVWRSHISLLFVSSDFFFLPHHLKFLKFFVEVLCSCFWSSRHQEPGMPLKKPHVKPQPVGLNMNQSEALKSRPRFPTSIS